MSAHLLCLCLYSWLCLNEVFLGLHSLIYCFCLQNFLPFFFYFHLFCLQSLPIFWEEKASLNLLKHSFTRISPLEWKFQEGFCAQYCILSYSILTTLSFRIEPGSWWILKSVFVGRLDSCFSSVYSQCFLSLTSFTYHCL